MSHMQDSSHEWAGEGKEDDIEQQLLYGLNLNSPSTQDADSHATLSHDEDQANHLISDLQGSDLQGALGLFAEASQDMATAAVELGLGRHFACVDFCNQAAEKAVQAISLLRFGRRTTYNHDLRELGTQVGAPDTILDDLERLTPFHPETFYADTPPEVADEVINAEQANSYIKSARTILRWARSIVLGA
ncbi:HEPN domain-containing protein [Dictyobacter arantiisoli]|nr:HEPN domain-containing protein [Dictyobacter arantiisoli]